MRLFKRRQQVDDKNNRFDEDVIACNNIIADYLLVLPKSGQWEDWELLEKLVTKGHDKPLSWYVIGLIPIITGRELIKDKGVTFSNSVVLYDDSFKPSRPIEFNNFPVYRAIMQSWHRIIAHPNIKNIMMRSAEIAVVNKLLNDRKDPRGFVFTEPGLSPPP